MMSCNRLLRNPPGQENVTCNRKMRRRMETTLQSSLRKSKLDPNGKCGVAVKQQLMPSEPPVEAKVNPIHFLERKSNDELVVHWTRTEKGQFPPIKLMPPW